MGMSVSVRCQDQNVTHEVVNCDREVDVEVGY